MRWPGLPTGEGNTCHTAPRAASNETARGRTAEITRQLYFYCGSALGLDGPASAVHALLACSVYRANLEAIVRAGLEGSLGEAAAAG